MSASAVMWGVKQRAVPVVSFAAVEHQPIAHRGQRFNGSREKLCEQDLCANIPAPQHSTTRRSAAISPSDTAICGVRASAFRSERRLCEELHLNLAYRRFRRL